MLQEEGCLKDNLLEHPQDLGPQVDAPGGGTQLDPPQSSRCRSVDTLLGLCLGAPDSLLLWVVSAVILVVILGKEIGWSSLKIAVNMALLAVFAPYVLFKILGFLWRKWGERSQRSFQDRVIMALKAPNDVQRNEMLESYGEMLESYGSGCCQWLRTTVGGCCPDCVQTRCGKVKDWLRFTAGKYMRRFMSRMSALFGVYIDIGRTYSLVATHPCIAGMMGFAIVLPLFVRALVFRPYEVESMMAEERWGAWLWRVMSKWTKIKRGEERSLSFKLCGAAFATHFCWFLMGLVYLPLRDAWLLLYWFRQEPLNAPDFHYLNLRWLAQVFVSKTLLTLLQIVVFIQDGLVHDNKVYGPVVALLQCIYAVCNGCFFLTEMAQLEAGGSRWHYFLNMRMLHEGYVPSSVLQSIRFDKEVHITAGQLDRVRLQGLLILSQCIQSSAVLTKLTFDYDLLSSLAAIPESQEMSVKNFFQRIERCRTLEKIALVRQEGEEEVGDKRLQKAKKLFDITKKFLEDRVQRHQLDQDLSSTGGADAAQDQHPLSEAVRLGNEVEVRRTLQEVRPEEQHLRNALKCAMQRNDLGLTSLLLEARADVRPSLRLAMERNDLGLTRHLLLARADVRPSESLHPLCFAAERNDSRLTMLLLLARAEVDSKSLCEAASAGANDVLSLLLALWKAPPAKKAAPTNSPPEVGEDGAPQVGSRSSSSSSVSAASTPRPDGASRDPQMAHCASSPTLTIAPPASSAMRHSMSASAFPKGGASRAVKQTGSRPSTSPRPSKEKLLPPPSPQVALEVAAQEGHSRILQQLLEHKAEDWPAYDEEGKSKALEKAAKYGHISTVTQLLEHRAAVDSVAGCHPVRAAAEQGHVHVLELLLTHCADINKEGASALPSAVREGQVACVRWLLEKGAQATPQLRRDPEVLHNVDIRKLFEAYPPGEEAHQHPV